MPRKQKNFYWTDDQEQACVDYGLSQDTQERNQIYNKFLRKPLRQMVEIIIRRYHSNNLGGTPMEELEEEALAHVVSTLGKFTPNSTNSEGKKTKAYSYYGTVVRNYLKTHAEKNSRRKKVISDNLDVVTENVEWNQGLYYEYDYDEETTTSPYELFIERLIEEVESYIEEEEDASENEKLIMNSLSLFFENWQIVFAQELEEGTKLTNTYLKSKIFLFIREQTKLENKDIRATIKKFMPRYEVVKQSIYREYGN